jgi:hypothetical protein
MRLGARIIAEKNEKFCWTPEQVLCDKEKTAPKSNRSPNSCFNYENTTHYLPLFTRVRVGFARTSSASGTSAAGNRRYESSGSGTDESRCRSAAAARDKLGAGAAATAARRTRRGRTTSSSRPTWSARRSDQSGGSWRNKSGCSRSGESFPSCCSHSGKACWFFSQQLVDRPVSQRRSGDVADSDRLNRSAHRCARAMHLVGWPVVPAGPETDRESFHRN